MKLLGLTGGIACGKSTACAFLKQHSSWPVVDADAVCHDIYAHAPDFLADALRKRWGADAVSPDGSVNRSVLSRRVFGDGGLAELNALTHPLILERVRKETERLNGEPIAILDVPLLFETGWDRHVWRVAAVWCDEPTQRARLAARGLDSDAMERRLAAQWSADEKLAKADYGLINNGSPTHLERQCMDLIERIEKDLAGE